MEVERCRRRRPKINCTMRNRSIIKVESIFFHWNFFHLRLYSIIEFHLFRAPRRILLRCVSCSFVFTYSERILFYGKLNKWIKLMAIIKKMNAFSCLWNTDYRYFWSTRCWVQKKETKVQVLCLGMKWNERGREAKIWVTRKTSSKIFSFSGILLSLFRVYLGCCVLKFIICILFDSFCRNFFSFLFRILLSFH